MHSLLKTGATAPICKPGSSFALLKLSSSITSPFSATFLASQTPSRAFSLNQKVNKRARGSNRSPGRTATFMGHVPHRLDHSETPEPFF